MNVASKYGMIMPGETTTQAVRSVFVIDPTGIIRTVLQYPLSLGRNFDELLRIVKGLQTADHFDVAMPADWRPGSRLSFPQQPQPAPQTNAWLIKKVLNAKTGSSVPRQFLKKKSKRQFGLSSGRLRLAP